MEKPTLGEPFDARGPSKVRNNPSSYCPICSKELAPRNCKLICPGCGYYMSCSDFY